MLDNFKEEVVVNHNTLIPNLLYMLAWIALIFFGFFALISVQFLFTAFSPATLLAFVLSAGAAVALFLFKDRLKVEYEYTFTNGTLDFARVFHNTSRKELGSMNVKNVAACGHVAHDSFNRYLSMNGVEKKNWFLNRDGNLFYFYYEKNSGKHMIIIEPSEDMVEMIRGYLPFGVYQG